MKITFLQSGFRPFFLAAALTAAILPPLWGLIWTGLLPAASPLPALHWHVHEMVFGFVGAVLAGFLLTAGAVWTRSVTARGLPLLLLVLAWVLGRVVVLVDVGLPGALVALPDALWLAGTAVAVGRPVVLTRSWRNLIFPLLMLALAALHVVMVVLPARGVWAWTVSLDLVLVALVVVTGRIVPMFTRNGLGDPRITRWPLVDRAANLGVMALVTTSALELPYARGGVALLLGTTLLIRMIPTRPWLTLRRPLIAVLHLGVGWLAIGLLLLAGNLLAWGVPRSAALHALTVGATATLCIGMMARVSRGHTARPLVAAPLTTAAFVSLTVAAVARVWIGWSGYAAAVLIVVSVLFGLAFALWLPEALRILLAPRHDGKPG